MFKGRLLGLPFYFLALPMTPPSMRLVRLRITEFSKEGHGIGIWPERAPAKVEVPFSVPGDEVIVHLRKRKRGVYQGYPVEWICYSPQRIPPLCQHFSQCGGCRWQQIAYEDQLKQKEAWVRHFLSPVLSSSVVWHPIIPCLPPWVYRNKMELTFSSDKAGERYLGLILYGTRGHVFQMKECHLIHSWVVETVQAVSRWWEQSGLEAYHGGRNTGSLRTLTLREGQHTGDRMVMLTVSSNPDYSLNQRQLQQFVVSLREAIEPSNAEQKLSIFLRIQQVAKGKPTQFYEMLLYGPDHIREEIHLEEKEGKHQTLQFRISPTSFFQPNTRQAERLYSRAIQMTQASSQAIVYDLYCGTGTMGICMARYVKEVIGIELTPESVLDAKENIKLNQLTNVSIHAGDVGRLLPLLLEERPHPDVVMVDPPRAGLDQRALQHLIKLKAPTLTYISCNPVTQAENLAVLIEGGYRVQAVQAVDQFPQTVHVENIVVLTR
jgi:23S rRNA (uracil1939-C5)-methyltransferase